MNFRSIKWNHGGMRKAVGASDRYAAAQIVHLPSAAIGSMDAAPWMIEGARRHRVDVMADMHTEMAPCSRYTMIASDGTTTSERSHRGRRRLRTRRRTMRRSEAARATGRTAATGIADRRTGSDTGRRGTGAGDRSFAVAGGSRVAAGSRRTITLGAWLAVAAVTACASPPVDRAAGRASTGVATASDGSGPTSTATATARSRDGMVVSAQPAATAVGVRVLERGGNAVDAAVATAFALTVVEPSMSSIGGRTQLLIRTAAGEFVGIDGTTQVASGYDETRAPPTDLSSAGYGTIAIPGTVAALATALDRYGSWPLDRVLAPAIALAEDGFVVRPAAARRMAAAADRLARSPGARRAFLKPDGEPYDAGERLRQPVLAETLRRIARAGPDEFYAGEIASRMVADIAGNGGFVTAFDLAGYRAEPAIVVRGGYRGHDLVGTFLPASGATTIEILQILERFELPVAEVGTARWVALIAQASRIAFADRVRDDLGPPARMARTLTSQAWAAERAREIRDGPPGPSGALRPERQGAVTAPAGEYALAHESPNTTHLSVADRDGAVVALTQSIGPSFGSHVATPGLGFIYASTQGYLATEPGERPWSSQSPLIVLRDDRPEFVLGGAGARRIISALVQVLSRAIDQVLSFADALAAPRFHTLDDVIRLEDRPGARWPTEVYRELRTLGLAVDSEAAPPYFARINGIHYDAAAGEFVGVADPRRSGAAAAPGGTESRAQ